MAISVHRRSRRTHDVRNLERKGSYDKKHTIKNGWGFVKHFYIIIFMKP